MAPVEFCNVDVDRVWCGSCFCLLSLLTRISCRCHPFLVERDELAESGKDALVVVDLLDPINNDRPGMVTALRSLALREYVFTIRIKRQSREGKSPVVDEIIDTQAPATAYLENRPLVGRNRKGRMADLDDWGQGTHEAVR